MVPPTYTALTTKENDMSFAVYEVNGSRLNLTLDHDDLSQFPEQISAKLVWAAALMAKELNGDYVKREGRYDMVSWIDNDDNKRQTYEQVNLSNRSAMMGLLYYYPSHLNDYLEAAETMISDLQLDFMFKVLADDAEGYEDGLAKVIGKEKLNTHDFGVIAFAPYYAEQQKKRRNLTERLIDSHHIGSVDDVVNLALENIRVSPSYGEYGGWNVTAITDNNCLVSFYTSKAVFEKQDGWYGVTAKVKAHQVDWKTKTIPETRLNYVKLL